MPIIKTESEIKKIKIAAQILAKVRKEVLSFVRPGITTLELDSIAYKHILKLGGKPSFLGYYDFPNTICASVNEILIHGIPNSNKLKNGDLLSLDFGVSFKGYHADAAITVSVGTSTPENEKMISVAKNAFYKAFKLINLKTRIGDLGYEIEKYVKKNKMFVPLEFAGHGIGSNLHEDPTIFNYGIPNTGMQIKNGMIICIEPMIMQESQELKILKDKWTVLSVSGKKTAHFEHTILIENGKPIILTKGENE